MFFQTHHRGLAFRPSACRMFFVGVFVCMSVCVGIGHSSWFVNTFWAHVELIVIVYTAHSQPLNPEKGIAVVPHRSR